MQQQPGRRLMIVAVSRRLSTSPSVTAPHTGFSFLLLLFSFGCLYVYVFKYENLVVAVTDPHYCLRLVLLFFLSIDSVII